MFILFLSFAFLFRFVFWKFYFVSFHSCPVYHFCALLWEILLVSSLLFSVCPIACYSGSYIANQIFFLPQVILLLLLFNFLTGNWIFFLSIKKKKRKKQREKHLRVVNVSISISFSKPLLVIFYFCRRRKTRKAKKETFSVWIVPNNQIQCFTTIFQV